jgi:alpha-glucosidase
MLELYRSALRLRRDHPGFRAQEMTWLDAPPGVLRFRRGDDLEVVVNLTSDDVPLSLGDRQVVLASVPLPAEGGRLPGDAAVWLG